MNTGNQKDPTKGNSDDDDFFAAKQTFKKTKITPPNNQNTYLPPKIVKIDISKPLKPTPSFQKEKSFSTFPSSTFQTQNTTQVPPDCLLICAWNINGLRPVTEKHYLQNYFKMKKPDILCLCETKSSQETIDGAKLTSWIPYNYKYYSNCSKVKKGCYGTGIITKHKPLSIEYGIGSERFDPDGRTITFEYEKFYLVNCYVPNSSDDFSHLPERVHEWDPVFRAYLKKLKDKKPVVLCGDLNIIHKNIDLARLVELGKVAGSSEEEKSNFNALLKTGFVDTFRHFYPQEKKYTWWNFKIPIHRKQNKGRRYDYVVVSDDALKGVKDAFIDDFVYGSDHCPVGIVFNPNIDNKDLEESKMKEEKEAPKSSQSTLDKSDSLEIITCDNKDFVNNKKEANTLNNVISSKPQVICIDSD